MKKKTKKQEALDIVSEMSQEQQIELVLDALADESEEEWTREILEREIREANSPGRLALQVVAVLTMDEDMKQSIQDEIANYSDLLDVFERHSEMNWIRFDIEQGINLE